MAEIQVTGKTASNLIDDRKTKLIAEVQAFAKAIIESLDWQVVRHIGQLKLIEDEQLVSTSLTNEEYLAVEAWRQSGRDLTNYAETIVPQITTEADMIAAEDYFHAIPPTQEGIPGQAVVEAWVAANLSI